MVFVLQLWAYEVLGLHPPETTHPQANEVIPRALCWGDDFRQHSYPRVTLDTLRASLDRLSGGGVSLTLICTYMEVVLCTLLLLMTLGLLGAGPLGFMGWLR
jgi:hypothetical protein